MGFTGTTVIASVNQIKKAFGPAKFVDNTGMDKVNFDWRIKIGDDNFSIYDWKEYRPLNEDEMIEFHIGVHMIDSSKGDVNDRLEKSINQIIEKIKN